MAESSGKESILSGEKFNFPIKKTLVLFFKASQNYTVIQIKHDYSALCFI